METVKLLEDKNSEALGAKGIGRLPEENPSSTGINFRNPQMELNQIKRTLQDK